MYHSIQPAAHHVIRHHEDISTVFETEAPSFSHSLQEIYPSNIPSTTVIKPPSNPHSPIVPHHISSPTRPDSTTRFRGSPLVPYPPRRAVISPSLSTDRRRRTNHEQARVPIFQSFTEYNNRLGERTNYSIVKHDLRNRVNRLLFFDLYSTMVLYCIFPCSLFYLWTFVQVHLLFGLPLFHMIILFNSAGCR